MSLLRKVPISDATGEEHSHARQIIERWQRRGFDTLVCYRSGYCSPANSRALRAPLPVGYCVHPLDSEEALAGLAASIAEGMAYRS